ncbi:hypothetical protein H310_07948 [Aphanomyces invadans]|uniref:Uncharacterized protein n=1 Tax=Aphanomyces invadans TaxID=157072 RepID=A0A024U233_9STRA|nr:hypothetical protein H310_07948 [Aphanomyces invadans]ETV99921.1 hypothetical protein H310_07948 [Aphanomyces invadans]|eukprot:XP_008871697.1 hypothetical protein H310_07948 [Aphanomyces invadans]
MSVLVVKRWAEIPRRPLGVWLFDASKQAIGAGVAHAANIAIAIALVGYTDTGTTDECAMYFVNFSLDTSLGVVFNWMLLTLVTTAAKRMRWTALQTPGDYGDPVRVRVWLLQLLSWLGVILTAKLLIGRGIVYFQAGLVAYAAWVFAPLEGHPRVELIVVMVACPCLMNALQFWVQDSFLKKKTKYDLLPRTDKGHGKHHAGYHEYDVSDAPPSPPPYSLQSASLHHHPHHPSR